MPHAAAHRSASDSGQLLSVRTVADPRPGRVAVEVVGEVDTYTAPVLDICLQSQASQPGVRELVVHLGQVQFLGAAGIEVLVQAADRCRTRGARLVIHPGGRRTVLRCLKLAGLDTFVAVDPVDGDPAHPSPDRVRRMEAGCRCRPSAVTRRRGRDPQPGPRRPA